MKQFFQDKKNILILVLLTLAAVSFYENGPAELLWILSGVFFCGLLDFLINKIVFKKQLFPKSAIITGFILSGILSYHENWWWLLIFSAAAIISKHLIRINNKHIFNPANFGLFAATLLGFPLIWGIESNIYIIIIFYKMVIYIRITILY